MIQMTKMTDDNVNDGHTDNSYDGDSNNDNDWIKKLTYAAQYCRNLFIHAHACQFHR